MRESYDVCVIGGGAAGMSAAIAAAGNGCRVCLLDKNKKLGKKLYATGNGRCNLANADENLSHYHSASPNEKKEAFLKACLGEEKNKTLFSFLHSIGIYEREENGYFYPSSMQASSVVWAFLDQVRSMPVTIKEAETVTEIKQVSDGYCIYGNETIYAKNVILACGGRSYTSLGGCMHGYEIAKKLELPLQKQRPALCGLYTREDTEPVKGVRVSCTAWIEDTPAQKQRGDLQITEYGLSGIMMFNLSSGIGAKLETKKDVPVVIDFLESIPREQFTETAGIHRTLYGYLNAYLPDKLALYIIHACEMQPKCMVQEVSREALEYLYDVCRAFRFHVVDLKDYEAAQVTSGGISLEAVNPKTMELTAYPGLYATGELLDIDGDCGGYNLTFAILTGLRAGRNCYA